MHKKDAIIKDLGRFKRDISRNVPIKKMILFGSMARGNIHRDSDIDLIIVSDKFKGKKSFKRSLGFYKYWELDYPVDFLCYTPREFNRLKAQMTIVREAEKTGIIV